MIVALLHSLGVVKLTRKATLLCGAFTAATTGPATSIARAEAPTELLLYDTRLRTFVDAPPQLSLAMALQKRSAPRVIFVGEEHTHRLQHAYQLEVIKTIDNLDDTPTLIGLEMCWRQHQRALDAYIFGSEAEGGGSIATLAMRTGWRETWGYPISLYSDNLRTHVSTACACAG